MRIFFYLIFGFSILAAQGQNSSYTSVYGGSSDEHSVDMEQLSTGDHFVVSNTLSYGTGNYDILLTKTDGLGQELWSYAYGTSGNDLATSLLVTSDGGVLITGYTDGIGTGNEVALVLKVNSSGTMSWNK